MAKKNNQQFCDRCEEMVNLEIHSCFQPKKVLKMPKKDFNRYGVICPKKTCEKCGSKFIPDDNEDKCSYCSQDPMEEIDFINERKERERMKKNGI